MVPLEFFLPAERAWPGGPWIVRDTSPQKSSLPQLHGRAYLNKAAKFEHIHPACKSEKDADKKSVERNSRYRQKPGEYNIVFQVHPDDFTLEPDQIKGGSQELEL